MRAALCILLSASPCDMELTGGDNLPGQIEEHPFCSNPSIALTLDAPKRLPASAELQLRGSLHLPRDVTALALNVGIRQSDTGDTWSPDLPVTPTVPQFATWSATIPASVYPTIGGGNVEVVAVAQLNCGTVWAATGVLLVPAPALAPATLTVTALSMFALDLAVAADVSTSCRATPTAGIEVRCGETEITTEQFAMCATKIDVAVTTDAIAGTMSTVTCRDDLGQQATSVITIFKE